MRFIYLLVASIGTVLSFVGRLIWLPDLVLDGARYLGILFFIIVLFALIVPRFGVTLLVSRRLP